MRIPVFLIPFALAALHPGAHAQRAPFVTQLAVTAGTEVAELRCERKPPAARAPAPSNPDPLEVPSADLVRTMLPAEVAEVAAAAPPVVSPWSAARPIPSKDGFRIAIWGDSHLAANFFGEELARLLKVPTHAPAHVLVPANMGRAGVRLPLRQSCVSPHWKYELAYLGGEGAAAPGPGMVNMVSDQAGATLAWDLRQEGGGAERVRILYQQPETPVVVSVAVDGGAGKDITLAGPAGPAVLELAAPQPLAQVSLRLVEGRLRFHGLELAPAQPHPFVLDVFGYPGATVASWKHANPDYLGTWLGARDYQLVMLEFGTNEGNAKPFDLGAYRVALNDSVRNMKASFPQAACILIGPGDRGVLVPRSANLHKKRGAKAKTKAKAKAKAAPDLFQYARIHAAINQVQAEVAAQSGCIAWSMQDAMGGQGSAYDWAQQSPALMAKDLIHFTAAGYRRLAREFAQDMGWTAPATP